MLAKRPRSDLCNLNLYYLLIYFCNQFSQVIFHITWYIYVVCQVSKIHYLFFRKKNRWMEPIVLVFAEPSRCLNWRILLWQNRLLVICQQILHWLTLEKRPVFEKIGFFFCTESIWGRNVIPWQTFNLARRSKVCKDPIFRFTTVQIITARHCWTFLCSPLWNHM